MPHLFVSQKTKVFDTTQLCREKSRLTSSSLFNFQFSLTGACRWFESIWMTPILEQQLFPRSCVFEYRCRLPNTLQARFLSYSLFSPHTNDNHAILQLRFHCVAPLLACTDI